jgi:hypothetical protein
LTVRKFGKLIALFALSATRLTHAEEVDWRTMCSSASNFAETVMVERQSGTSMAKLIKSAEGNDFLETIIISAYEVTRHGVDSNKQNSVGDFRNKA